MFYYELTDLCLICIISVQKYICWWCLMQLSLIFSIYRSAALSNGIYVLLGLGLVGFLMIEVIMVSIYPVS